ncbi:MAG: hypothetical protein HS108_06100 [Planctomycetes bacterium]|nr:hypothetical protein [Planctomycetota bacterium]
MSCLLLLATLVAGCASARVGPPPPEPRGTTLRRYHTERVTLEDLEASREGALACARLLTLLERELREPWQEHRDARLLLQHVRTRDPLAAALAVSAWESAEAPAAGSDRRLFAEFGVYGSGRLPGGWIRRADTASAEEHAGRMLATLREDTPAARVLSGWRRLAPEVQRRQNRYLASCWRFVVGLDTEIELRDSLLGPFERCAVTDAGSVSGMGPLDGLDDFQMPHEILDMLAPGTPGRFVDLATAMAGGGLPRGFRLAAGPVESRDREGDLFLGVALRGLAEGVCDLEYLPSGALTVQVTFSYLLDTAEARASIGLRRLGHNEWQIESFHYEPAAASLMGQRGARLDLMPLLRSRLGT